jgi:hypothetical protein
MKKSTLLKIDKINYLRALKKCKNDYEKVILQCIRPNKQSPADRHHVNLIAYGVEEGFIDEKELRISNKTLDKEIENNS